MAMFQSLEPPDRMVSTIKHSFLHRELLLDEAEVHLVRFIS